MLATPALGGHVTTAYHRSVLLTLALFVQRGISFKPWTADLSDIVLARNIAASTALNDPKVTHLLFLDSDMDWRPAAVAKMIDANKPLVGCAYPLRRPQQGLPSDFAIVNPNGTGPLIKADYIGTGLLLIQRGVLERLASTVRKSTKHEGGAAKGTVYGFFDNITDDTERLGEDHSFCARWRATGGEVWAVTDEEIGHVGTTTYRGRFSTIS